MMTRPEILKRISAEREAYYAILEAAQEVYLAKIEALRAELKEVENGKTD
uniref:Uncharacterized protein n=1 Tax=viral metagenome TaxID=1070528 RepID=A0A6M3JJF4_9ZZZZ